MTNKNQDLTDIFDNNLSISTREIYLCGNEGEVDEKLTMGFLKNLRILENKSKDPIIIHQYSVGGDWNAGMAMYDAIRIAHVSLFTSAMESLLLWVALFHKQYLVKG